MQQLAWNPRQGRIELLELPSPQVGAGQLRVANAFSVISSGTERIASQISLRNPRAVLRARPDAVAKLKRVAQNQGLRQAFDLASARMSELQPVGYSSAGIVVEVGPGADGWACGDRVACAGAGFANHASEIVVPVNLCARIPPQCDLESAAFATVGAISMQAFRLAGSVVGERVLIIGLGLLGQLAARIATAAGCIVSGADLDPARVQRMLDHGGAHGFTMSAMPERGDFDAVIVTAGSSDASPLEAAGRLCRPRGRVVAVGLFPLELQRDLFYHKEIEFVVSRSTGPGRYDPLYEEFGIDYPVDYVRWTEQRNLASFLDLIARGRLAVSDMISHRYPLADGIAAYGLLGHPVPGQMALVLTYPAASQVPQQRVELRPAAAKAAAARVALVGAGAFAKAVLLPAFRAAGAEFAAVCTHRPLVGRDAAVRFGAAAMVRDVDQIWQDPAIPAVLVATRHDSHAELVGQALLAGKAVFVEKPLAVSLAQLQQIAAAAEGPAAPRIMVGFNRRFAPLSRAVKAHVAGMESQLVMVYRANAGHLAANHWTQMAEQGGRIVGEACHFIDWLSFMADSLPVQVLAAANRNTPTGDDMCINLQFANGAVAALIYTSAGGANLGKERIEVFAGGCTAVIDDWREGWLGRGSKSKRLKLPGKGHNEEALAFVAALSSGAAMPISFASLQRTTEATLAVSRSLAEGRAIALPLAPAAEAQLEVVIPVPPPAAR